MVQRAGTRTYFAISMSGTKADYPAVSPIGLTGSPNPAVRGVERFFRYRTPVTNRYAIYISVLRIYGLYG